MNSADLKIAIEAARVASVEHQNQIVRVSKLETELPVAKSALDAAEAELVACLGRDALNEGTPAATKKARSARDEASERVRGIESALSVLRARVAEQADRVKFLERDARLLAIPFAEAHRDRELDAARAHFRLGAAALRFATDLQTFVNGTEISGMMDAQWNGIGEILKEHRITTWTGGDVMGSNGGNGRAMSVIELLALFQPEPEHEPARAAE